MQRQGVAASVSCYFDGEVHSLQGFAKPGSTICDRLLLAMDQAGGDASALLKGIFLGDKTVLSFSQKSDLAFAGVFHAFAVSGLHVAYIVAAAVLIAGTGRRRRWLRLLLAAAFLWFCLYLTGMAASIVRAVLMSLVILAADACDEKSDSLTTLSLSAWLCLLYKPLWLFDAGFLLSFAAVGGMIYLLPAMRLLLIGQSQPLQADSPLEGQERAQGGPSLRFRQAKYFALEALAITLAASFATMPLIGYYFYHISLVGWLVSPIFVLVSGPAVQLCFLAAGAAIFSSTLAALPLFAADLIMRPLMALSSVSATLPGAYIASGQTPLPAVLLFYALLLPLPYFIKKRQRPRLFLSLALAGMVLFLSLAPALAHPADGQLEITFIDVGQGDATLILTPQRQSILVDGGGNLFNSDTVGENVLMPYLRYRGFKSIDLLISSHPDADHIDGLLTVLENMRVGQLLYADAFPDSELQQQLLSLAERQGVKLTSSYAGQRFALGPGLTLNILNPPAGTSYSELDNNAGCLSFLLRYGETGALFTGDAPFSALSALPPAQVVKLPHHGSKSGYDEQAYAQLQPTAVIISVGRDNSYGHPAAAVVEYWQDRAAIFRTDLDGAITCKSDGRQWQISTFW